MDKVYLVHEDDGMRQVLDDTYETMLAGLKHKTSSAKSLIDDIEFSKLHDLLALLRCGHIDIKEKEALDGRMLILDIKCNNK